MRNKLKLLKKTESLLDFVERNRESVGRKTPDSTQNELIRALGVVLLEDLVVAEELLAEVNLDFLNLFSPDIVFKRKKNSDEFFGGFEELQEESALLENLNPSLLRVSEESTVLDEAYAFLEELLVEKLEEPNVSFPAESLLSSEVCEHLVEEEVDVIVHSLLNRKLLQIHHLLQEALEILLEDIFELLFQVGSVKVDLQGSVLFQFFQPHCSLPPKPAHQIYHPVHHFFGDLLPVHDFSVDQLLPILPLQ